VSRRSRHTHDDYRSSRFPHHLYSVPPIRLTAPLVRRPRCSRGRSWGDRTLETAEAHSPGEFTAALLRRRCGRRAAIPNRPAAQARTSSATIAATPLIPQGPVPRVHRPPRSIGPPAAASSNHRLRLRRIHLGTRRGEASVRVLGGSSASSDRRLRDRSRQVGGVGAVEQERRPTPAVHPDMGAILRPG
jgi:hypothetical protein